MARIRSIKPEFWADEKLAPLDAITRLVFLGLISHADDLGRLVDSIKQLDALIFPETDESVREALARLSRIGRVIRGKTASGQSILQIANWSKHQRVDHPNKLAALPEIVEPQQLTEIRETFPNDSRDIPEPLATRSTIYDLRSTISTSISATKKLSRGLTDEEQEVLAHYAATHTRRKTDDKLARRYIGAGLKSFTVQELKQAIDGNANDPWHAKHGKHELSYVLRNAEKISEFLNRAAAEPRLLDSNGDESLIMAAMGLQ